MNSWVQVFDLYSEGQSQGNPSNALVLVGPAQHLQNSLHLTGKLPAGDIYQTLKHKVQVSDSIPRPHKEIQCDSVLGLFCASGPPPLTWWICIHTSESKHRLYWVKYFSTQKVYTSEMQR